MGNGMTLYFKPDVTPDYRNDSAYDPNFGFEKPRKERVMIATQEEMMSAKLLMEERDYCAHKLIQYKACRADVWPWAYKCAPEKHEFLNCQYEDYVYRLKDYERERRLMERQKRIDKAKRRQEQLA